MPKTGLPTSIWHQRVQQYAKHQYKFGRGERPPKSSVWSRVLDKIDKCPRHQSDSGLNLFGQAIECICGYHKVGYCLFFVKSFFFTGAKMYNELPIVMRKENNFNTFINRLTL